MMSLGYDQGNQSPAINNHGGCHKRCRFTSKKIKIPNEKHAHKKWQNHKLEIILHTMYYALGLAHIFLCNLFMFNKQILLAPECIRINCTVVTAINPCWLACVHKLINMYTP